MAPSPHHPQPSPNHHILGITVTTPEYGTRSLPQHIPEPRGLLLLWHVDIDGVDPREQAAKYDLEDENDALCRYLETDGKVDDGRLPEWDEFQKLSAEYAVPLTELDQYARESIARGRDQR